MIYNPQPTIKIAFCLTLLIAFSAASAQTTTTSSGSVSLFGAGSLSFTVTHQGLTPCNAGSRQLTPSFQRWTFSGFEYIDASGVSHALSGGTTFISVAGSGTTCPQAGGSPVVLNGNGFSIRATPGPGSLAASINIPMFPKYFVMSILYAPPGNQSSSGFGQANSQATTTTISKSFQDSISTNVGISIPGGSGVNVTTGSSTTNASSQAFQVTTSQQAGSAVISNRNPIDHTQDQFYLWLNPMVILTPTSTSTSNYTMGTVIGSNGQPEPMDIVAFSVEALQNPSTIKVDEFNPRLEGGVMVPGLSSICAKPVLQCTTAPCGCVASDFTAILQQDPLIGTSVTTALSTLDPNRFVFINNTTLQGPDCAGCDEKPNTFQESDGTSTTNTLSQSDSYSVGFSVTSGINFFGGGLSITNSNTFTYTNGMSVGKSNGASHSESLNLETSSVGCIETVDIYEDTVYHIFAFALEGPPPAECN